MRPSGHSQARGAGHGWRSGPDTTTQSRGGSTTGGEEAEVREAQGHPEWVVAPDSWTGPTAFPDTFSAFPSLERDIEPRNGVPL